MQAQDELSESELQSNGVEQIAFSKTLGIIRSSSAIISLVSSSIFIWILHRSKARFSSIYHRMLLGMSVGDILMSLSLAHFNYASPSDDDYFVWNARGNQATCSAQGFAGALGAQISVYYACSLILYSLAVVKYNKGDSYIRNKIEPFLHGVPIGLGLIYNTVLLAKKNLNARGCGICSNPVYYPPHCIGYADGVVREGFNIPCGRGSDGAVLFFHLNFFVGFFAVPIIIGTSLGMIYRAVKRQEQAIARYGAGSFAPNTNTYEASSGTCGWLRSTIWSAVSFLQGRRSSGHSSSTSNSRLVMRRAFAFTASFLLTWSFTFTGACFEVTNKDIPLAILYLGGLFNPLQGLFNLCIFLTPTVFKNKSRGDNDMTWFQAVMEAIWYSGRGDQSLGRREGRGGGHENRSPQPQPIEGERGTDKPKTNQTQRMTLQDQEKIQQAPGEDGIHHSHVPYGVDIDQSETVDP